MVERSIKRGNGCTFPEILDFISSKNMKITLGKSCTLPIFHS